MRDNIKRDKFMYSVLENDPGKFFQVARSHKMSRNLPIRELHVDDRIYEGDKVCDGFFDSIYSLKACAHTDLENCDTFNAANQEYHNILKLCMHGTKIPLITLEKTKNKLGLSCAKLRASLNLSGLNLSGLNLSFNIWICQF